MAVKAYQTNAELKRVNEAQVQTLTEMGAVQEERATLREIIGRLHDEKSELGKQIVDLTEKLALRPTQVISAGGNVKTTLDCPEPEIITDPTTGETIVVREPLPVDLDAESKIVELETVGRDLFVTGETKVTVSTLEDEPKILLQDTVPFDEKRTNFITLDESREPEDKGAWWVGAGVAIGPTFDAVLSWEDQQDYPSSLLDKANEMNIEFVLMREHKKRKFWFVSLPKMATYFRVEPFGDDFEAGVGALIRLGKK